MKTPNASRWGKSAIHRLTKFTYAQVVKLCLSVNV